MDDMAFPSYISSKARQKHTEFGESMYGKMICSVA